MATVYSVGLIAERGDGSLTEKKVNRTYEVVFTDSTAVPSNCYGATDGVTTVPSAGNTYDGTYVNTINADRDPENARRWVVQVGSTSNFFSTTIKPGGTGVIWDIHFASTGVMYQEPGIKDRASTPVELRIWNGEPVEPQLPLEYWDEEFRITFKTDQISSTVASYRGTSNTSSITLTIRGVSITYAANTLKLTRCDYQDYWENGSPYWAVELTLQYRADTWVTKIQPMSYQILDSGGANLHRPKDPVTNEFYCTPQYLATNGKSFIAVGTALPTPMSFQMLTKTNFSTLLSGLTTIP